MQPLRRLIAFFNSPNSWICSYCCDVKGRVTNSRDLTPLEKFGPDPFFYGYIIISLLVVAVPWLQHPYDGANKQAFRSAVCKLKARFVHLDQGISLLDYEALLGAAVVDRANQRVAWTWNCFDARSLSANINGIGTAESSPGAYFPR